MCVCVRRWRDSPLLMEHGDDGVKGACVKDGGHGSSQGL